MNEIEAKRIERLKELFHDAVEIADPDEQASFLCAQCGDDSALRHDVESLIAADLWIEGKIQGSGHIRIAGRFKGDVQVEGDLTVEVGAKLNGGVRARKVVVAGELEGNIESAQRVELLEGGTIVGDVKAGTVIVAAGSKMRGQVEFGWDDKDARKPSKSEGKAEPAASA